VHPAIRVHFTGHVVPLRGSGKLPGRQALHVLAANQDG
jgi:hypothetical protein